MKGAIVIAFLCAGCANASDPAPGNRSAREPRSHAKTPEASAPLPAPSAPAPTRWVKGPGVLPLDYPPSPAPESLQPGVLVFAPSPTAIGQAFEHGLEHQPLIWRGASLIETGPLESRVRTSPGAQWVVPNSTLLAPPTGAVEPGDVVLTEWQGQGTLQRALVVAGGEPDQPKVRYLDLPASGPGAALEAVKVPKGRFGVLGEPGAPGSTVACLADGGPRRYLLVHRSPKRWLGVGFAGRLKALDPGNCEALPIVPKTEVGATVHVPDLGRFVPAVVGRLEPEAGRVWVRLPGQKEERGVGYTNVALKLPAIPAKTP